MWLSHGGSGSSGPLKLHSDLRVLGGSWAFHRALRCESDFEKHLFVLLEMFFFSCGPKKLPTFAPIVFIS